jgi:hypothetical protein
MLLVRSLMFPIVLRLHRADWPVACDQLHPQHSVDSAATELGGMARRSLLLNA